MSKRKTEYKCPNDGRSKIFKEEGMNDVNFKRHVETCKHRKEMCKKEVILPTTLNLLTLGHY